MWLQIVNYGYLLIWGTLHSRRMRCIYHYSLARFGRMRRRISICSTAVSLRLLVTLATSFSLILVISFRCMSKKNIRIRLNMINLNSQQTSCEVIFLFIFSTEFLLAIRIQDDRFELFVLIIYQQLQSIRINCSCLYIIRY